MGYSDGIPRSANSEAGVLVGNKRAPIIGRVSMDQFVVDLGRDSSARLEIGHTLLEVILLIVILRQVLTPPIRGLALVQRSIMRSLRE